MIRLVLPLVLALAACQSQGDYTREGSEEARENMDRLHAGTDYDLALRLYESGDLDRALETVDRCISLVPDSPTSHLLRARILIELGDWIPALATLQAGAELEPGDSEFHYLAGVVQEQLGNLEAALSAYEKASELEPARAEVMQARGEVLVQLDRLDEARALLDVDQGPFAGCAGFRQALGHIALLQDDLEQAAVYFTEAAILSPSSPGITEDLARVQVALERYSEALETLDHLEPGSRRQSLRRLRVHCLVQNRQPVEARAVLMELTREPEGAEDFETWRLMADVALMLGDDRLLHSAADRLIQSGPARPEGLLALAMWKRRAGDLEGALQSARAAKERAPDDPTPEQLEELLLRDLAKAGG